MNLLYQVLGVPFGWVIWAIYQVISNYGIALILFTVLTKLLQYPLAVKQHKTSIRSSIMQPKIQEINKKYANNPQKRQEETVKLQQEYGFSPQAGCLPMLIQFGVLFGMIDVIYKPMTHILRLSTEIIEKAAGIADIATSSMNYQLGLITKIQENPDAFSELGKDVVNQITSLDLNFFGLNLGTTPSLTFPIILIPILAGVLSFLQMYIQRRLNPQTDMAAGGGAMKAMMFTMPLISVWISYTLPVGIGIYWMVGYIVQIVQSFVINKLHNPKELKEKALLEMEEKRKNSKKKVVQTTAYDSDGNSVIKEEKVSQKEANRRRLAAARKADAEKYGEIYSMQDESEDDQIK